MRGLLFISIFIALMVMLLGCGLTNQSISRGVFTLSGLIIEPREPATEESFSISITVTNISEIQDKYNANLCIDQVQIVDANNVTIISTKTFNKSETIKGGESIVLKFDSLSLQEGLYSVKIGDLVDYIEVDC